MRALAHVILASAVAGCSGGTIDAGRNDAAVVDAAGDGPVRLASLIQLVPTQLMSDGTSLFWVSSIPQSADRPMISSIPIAGGPIHTVVPQPADALLDSAFLIAVDDRDVYYLLNLTNIEGQAIYRAPKDGGGAPELYDDTADDAGVSTQAAALLGTQIYWLEQDPSEGGVTITTVKSAPLQGGSASTIAKLGNGPGEYSEISVTASTVFLLTEGYLVSGYFVGFLTNGLYSFPLDAGLFGAIAPTPVPSADPARITAVCQGPTISGQAPRYPILSDTDAIYCIGPDLFSVLRVGSDGTTTVLGMLVNLSSFVPSNLAFDDKYVYWTDPAAVGTIVRVPKSGGTPTIIARDAYPLAIAVDANAVYWSDQGGNLWRLAK
jgi:hypothetical protein